ncbi:MAG: hypothetical protein CME68_04125 [Halobacteriovoraceae bacterium]|nr:hypothetical protein [Halobacteriovoraceae bacterium]
MINVFKSKKVLIVDDDEKMIQVLGNYLRLNTDFNTAIAKNGQEAVERANNFRPDIILMDINMPIMDGVEACKKIKENKELKEIPIIFLTAQSSIEEKVRALKAQGSDYITKPFYEEELFLRLKLHLENSDSKEKIKTSLEKTNEMLNNISQSLFWVETTGKVLSPSSRSTDKVMGMNIEGKSVLTSLYKDMEHDKKNLINSFFKKSSGLRKENWKEDSKKLPNNINYINEKEMEKKILYANYKPIWNDKNVLIKIMIILDDRTELNYLINQKNVYSISLVSSLSGVQENTLRTWERRYKAFTPFRDLKGKRFYNEEELERVKLIKVAIDMGITIKALAHLDSEKIKQVIENAKDKKLTISASNNKQIGLTLKEYTQNIKNAILNKNGDVLANNLGSLINNPKLIDFPYDVFPVIFKGLQEDFKNEIISEDDLYSVIPYFKFHLNNLMFKNKGNGKKVIISFFENPFWELEVVQIALLCLKSNIDVIFYNSEKKSRDILAQLKNFGSDNLILSVGSSIIRNIPSSDEILKSLVSKLEGDKKIMITGNVNYSDGDLLKNKNITLFPNIEDLDRGLSRISDLTKKEFYKKSG